ncbi:crotonase/enoyl-CoA hydratase family protein [Nitrospirillum amazonense]|uniref:crotonase/enoyl-CoA hydratase family protein n=1 Tax=Nitrospirillum amazonense TaxID=28077 RepID=UPI00241287DE|nr:crotonase/enoyl-CoA hydratase family protein [Nitrospirillum amazonense]MDG3442945.1 crotonase/enoyl-CoA hydratase family protein [Nitrospirillum amazonense]
MTHAVPQRAVPQRVDLDIEGAIAHVRLTRPEKLNALDLDTLRQLVRTAATIRRQPQIRAVILSGEGAAFSAGLDFAAVTRKPWEVVKAFVTLGRSTNLFQRACWCWRELPVPVIAVLHGRCYGGALQVALAADFRIATPDCELSVMEGKWGLIPDMSGSVSLRELVPIDVAKRLTMTAQVISGTEAKALNLVTEVADDPMAAAEALAAELCARSPDAVAGAKALFQRAWSASIRGAFAAERRIQFKIMRGPNWRIALSAGLEKKAPQFRERSFRP